jgi:membrane-bound lytic murein transglycosylase D
VFACVLLLAIAAQTGARAEDQVSVGSAASSTGDAEFPRPPGLRTQIEFWKKIFATYKTEQVVFHDALHLDRIYSVLDFGAAAARLDAEAFERHKRDSVDDEKERIAKLLRRLARGGANGERRTDEERRILALFDEATSPRRLKEAADRVRAQSGLRERCARAIEIGRGYFPEMEAIFRREGVPKGLTRLPLVESSFNVHAYSRAGAAGVWQFIRATGRRYMRIDEAVDERRDPILSTVAAARYLRENYEALGTWPLAITAYNHGRAGIARAKARVGSSDLVDIIRRYESRTFGFASRNFYAEFIAALEVEADAERYYGALQVQHRAPTRRVTVPDYVSLGNLSVAAATPAPELADLNPALSRRVVSGELRVPKGYRLVVPEAASGAFASRYAKLPGGAKHARQRIVVVRHRVRRGETLWGLARRYGTTIRSIQRRNDLARADVLRVGQVLLVPSGGSRGGHLRHRVRRGQTLSSIARHYNTSVRAIQRANGLRNADRLQAGQHLIIPTKG